MSAKARSALGTHSVFNKKPIEIPPPPEANAEPIQRQRQRAQQAPDDRKLLPFRLSKAARYQLRLMAVELDKTQQDLFEEAMNDLFRKYGKPPIAG